MAKGGSLSTGSLDRTGPGIAVHARIEGAEKTSKEFREARRQFNAAMRAVIVEAGERAVLPAIKAKFPSRGFGESLYVKRDRTTVLIASRKRGSLNRTVGWLDFGGRRPRDSVRRRGRYTIVRELDRRREYIDQAILVALMKTFHPLETSP